MLELQSNPRLLVVCNHLHSLEGLDLNQPQFGPVHEILKKELPIANLANEATARHAKAVYALNMIRPTAVQTDETSTSSKTICWQRTRKCDDEGIHLRHETARTPLHSWAISRHGEPERSDSFFKEILSNAAITVTAIEDIETLGGESFPIYNVTILPDHRIHLYHCHTVESRRM